MKQKLKMDLAELPGAKPTEYKIKESLVLLSILVPSSRSPRCDLEKFQKCPESNPGPLREKPKCDYCAMNPTSTSYRRQKFLELVSPSSCPQRGLTSSTQRCLRAFHGWLLSQIKFSFSLGRPVRQTVPREECWKSK